MIRSFVAVLGFLLALGGFAEAENANDIFIVRTTSKMRIPVKADSDSG